MEILITGLTNQGAGVGRSQEGLAIFVPGALPGERVIANITRRDKRYAQGELLELKEVSPWRLTPPCPHSHTCGGCLLQHLAYEQQLLWKGQWVQEALRRIGGLETEVLPTLPSPQTVAYRSRAQLHVLRQQGRLQLGFYGRGSREGDSSSCCMLLRPLLGELAQLVEAHLPAMTEDWPNLRHVALRCGSRGDEAMLVLVGQPPEDKLRSWAQKLSAAEGRLISLWANWGAEVYGIYGPKWAKLEGEAKLPEQIAHLRLEISPAAFTQVNQEQALVMYELIADYAALTGSETLLDVYSGVGVIALYLAAKARQVIGVEDYAPAREDAAHNAALNGITNCRFEQGAAEMVLPRLGRVKPQVVVVDPPRAGCAPAAVEAICRLSPSRIVYVSCNPATLARDLRLLGAGGYVIRQVQPVDMFPHSGHVECVVLLTRKDG